MKTNFFWLGIILLSFLSCKSESDRTVDILTNYTKQRVRKPNSVLILKYEVYDSSSEASYMVKRSRYDYITNRTAFVRYLFSARNEDGNEVFREVEVIVNSNKEVIKSYPEKIDVENGYLTGTCKYLIGNPITNKGYSGYCDGGKVIILNLDTLSGNKVYRTTVRNGTYNINGITPGNYFLKQINTDVNLDIAFTEIANKNFFILMNIKEIMDFYDIYAKDLFGFSDRSLFDKTYKGIEEIFKSRRDFISDFTVYTTWNNFKKSINQEFITDFEIDNDYKYLNDFRKILINPSETTKENIDINEFAF